MKIYDISVPIRPGMPIYEGDPGVKIEPWSALAKGDSANGSQLLKTVEAEATKIDSYDWGAISDKIDAFYQPLIDDYNSEGHKATA